MKTSAANFPQIVSAMSEEILSNYDTMSAGGAGCTVTANAVTATPIGVGTVEWYVPSGVSCQARFNIGTVGVSASNAHFGPHVGIVLRSTIAIDSPISIYASATGQQSVAYNDAPNQNFTGILPDEWTVLWLCRDNFAKIGAAVDWCTNTTNQSLDVQRFDLLINPSANATIEIGGVVTYTPTKAKLIIEFDDNNDGVWDYVFSRFAAKGWRGVVPTVKDKVDTAAHLTTAQLQTLYDAGWDIINHSAEHIIDDASTYSVDDWFPQFPECRVWLVANGMTRSADLIVYPGNQARLPTADGGEVIDNICSWARGQASFTRYGGAYDNSYVYNTAGPIVPNNSLCLPYKALHGTSATDYTADMQAFITNLVNTREVGIVYTHNVVVTPSTGIDISVDFLDDMIAAIYAYEQAGLIEIVTMTDWINEINGFSDMSSAGGATGTGIFSS